MIKIGPVVFILFIIGSILYVRTTIGLMICKKLKNLNNCSA